MKQVIVLLLMFIGVAVYGQLEWQQKMKYESEDIHFAGSDGDKLFYVERNDQRQFALYHEKKGSKKVITYDVKNNTYKTYDIKIDKENWYVSYLLHGEKFHFFVSSYDKKAKEVSYWYAAYHTSDMSEASGWKLLQTEKSSQKVAIWKRNRLIRMDGSESHSDKGAKVILLYHFGVKGAKISHKLDGPILIFSEKGELIHQSKYDIEKEEEKSFGKKLLKQVLFQDDQNLVLLHHFKNLKGAGPKMIDGKFGVTKISLGDDSEKTIFIEEEKQIYLTGMLDTEESDLYLLATSVTKSKGKNRVAYYSLKKIDDNNIVTNLDKKEVQEKNAYYFNVNSPSITSYSSRKKDIGNQRTLMVFGDFKFPRDPAGFKDLHENGKKFRGFVINKADGLIEGVSEGMITESLTFLQYEKDNDFFFVLADKQFKMSKKGDIEKLESLPLKSKKFKTKIMPSSYLGYIEKSDYFIIVGSSEKDNTLFWGTLKK